MGISSYIPKLSRMAVPEEYRDVYEIQEGCEVNRASVISGKGSMEGES